MKRDIKPSCCLRLAVLTYGLVLHSLRLGHGAATV